MDAPLLVLSSEPGRPRDSEDFSRRSEAHASPKNGLTAGISVSTYFA